MGQRSGAGGFTLTADCGPPGVLQALRPQWAGPADPQTGNQDDAKQERLPFERGQVRGNCGQLGQAPTSRAN